MCDRVRYRTDPDWYEYRLTERALALYLACAHCHEPLGGRDIEARPRPVG